MRSLIVQKVAHLILLATLVFAVYLLLRGHEAPGGGFAAGIATTLGILVEAISVGFRRSAPYLRRVVSVAWGLGMVFAVGAACLHMATGSPFFTHFHEGVGLPGAGVSLTTVLLFDLGVYFVVVGSTATAVAVLAEAAAW